METFLWICGAVILGVIAVWLFRKEERRNPKGSFVPGWSLVFVLFAFVCLVRAIMINREVWPDKANVDGRTPAADIRPVDVE
jgi:hypothetical protein